MTVNLPNLWTNSGLPVLIHAAYLPEVEGRHEAGPGRIAEQRRLDIEVVHNPC